MKINNPFEHPLPKRISQKGITEFQKFLVMITLRPEKLNQGVMSFIKSKEKELDLMWESNLENHLRWINH